MKKLLSLTLCIVFICLALVSCGQDVIGEYLPNYNTNVVTDDQIAKLNLYIITGDGTSEDAKTTVPQNINTYLKEKYRIELNISYFTEAEYSTKLAEGINNTNESARPDIVLINSSAMYDDLYNNNRLVALNTGAFDFYNSRDFKKINTIVDDVLLAASADSEGTYYTVPNNHVIGNYEYIVIDKKMARDTLHFSNSEIQSMTTAESVAELEDAIATYFAGASYDVEDYVKVVADGYYDDQTSFKYIDLATGVKSDKEVNYVNIKAYPNATKEEAFLSAFAIVRELGDTGSYTEEEQAVLYNHYYACMKIIFALNDDPQLKNMLQYGYVGTNYKFITDERHENTDYIELISGPSVTYEMNPIYTGNPFISYYCDSISWNASTHNEWLKQNADATTPAQKLEAELSKLTLAVTDADCNTTVDLPLHGEYYTDVSITWTSDDANVVIDTVNGKLTFTNPDEDTVVKLTAVLSYYGSNAEKTVSINLAKVE